MRDIELADLTKQARRRVLLHMTRAYITVDERDGKYAYVVNREKDDGDIVSFRTVSTEYHAEDVWERIDSIAIVNGLINDAYELGYAPFKMKKVCKGCNSSLSMVHLYKLKNNLDSGYYCKICLETHHGIKKEL